MKPPAAFVVSNHFQLQQFVPNVQPNLCLPKAQQTVVALHNGTCNGRPLETRVSCQHEKKEFRQTALYGDHQIQTL